MNLRQRLTDLRTRLTQPPQLIEFPEQTTIVAKNQPQYRPLPAYVFGNDPEGKLIFCWKLSWRDRVRVFLGCPLWHTVLTFNTDLQPQLLLTDKPYLPLKPTKPWPRK